MSTEGWGPGHTSSDVREFFTGTFLTYESFIRVLVQPSYLFGYGYSPLFTVCFEQLYAVKQIDLGKDPVSPPK